MIDPDVVWMEDLKIRSGIWAEASWRNGAIVTLIEPEMECTRSSAGVLDGWGTTVILMEPDMVLMERRSWSRKVPLTRFDISLIMVERDIMSKQASEFG